MPRVKRGPFASSDDDDDDNDDDDKISLPRKKAKHDEAKHDAAKTGEGDKGESGGGWGDVFGARVGESVPSTFESALMWTSTTATRDQMHQLVGALNFPYTPFDGRSLLKMQNWWTKHRKELSKREDKFISAVKETYTRNREDEQKVVRDKEAIKEQRQKARQDYVEQFASDREVLSKGDFMWALIYPVDEYCSGSTINAEETGYRDMLDLVGRNSLRRAERSMKRKNKKLEKENQNEPDAEEKGAKPKKKSTQKDTYSSPSMASAPLLCRVKVTSYPKKRDGHPPANLYHWRPHKKPEVQLLEDVDVTYLKKPIALAKSMKKVPSEVLRSYNSDPSNMTVYKLKTQTILPISPPDFYGDDRTKYRPYEWTSWLRIHNPELKEKGLAFYDSGSDLDDEIHATHLLPETPTTPSQTIGLIKLLPTETKRYRNLLKKHHLYHHVTTIPDVWKLILQFHL